MMKKQAYLILELIQKFSRKEQKRFQQMVSAPFFNSDEKLLALLEIIIGHCTKHFDKDFNLAIAYNQLYNSKLRKLKTKQTHLMYSKMSLLLNLAQQFLMWQNLADKPAFKTALLQETLLAKKQYRLYEQFLNKKTKGLKNVVKGIDYYEHQYLLEYSRLTYLQLSGSISKHNNVVLIKDSLSLYYLFNLLDLYLIEISLAEFASVHQVDHTHFEALQPLLELPQIKKHPLTKVYQSVIDLLRKKTDEVFFILINDLDKYASSIPKDSLINFYNSAVNYCVLQLRKGKKAFDRHLLNLYKTMDTKQLLFIEDQMHLGNLRNIVTQSCRLEEFDWATEMLDKYETFIPKNIRSAVKDFYLGTIAYFKKDYQLSIDYLFPLPNINLSHDVNRRIFVMRAYYELDTEYLETTHTLFRSFEKYIREHKNLTSKNITSYKNFIRMLINLYRIKHGATKMQLSNLKQKLSAQKLNSNKSWLLEKINELGS